MTHSYLDALNELWNIMRDEYIAEMFCANIIKIVNSLKWYGNFNDDGESENFKFFLENYRNNKDNLDGNVALQLLHQYYFVPLFHKAGFLDGASKLISIKNIKVCDTIQDIIKCNVVNNKHVPIEFNDIVLRKWSEYRIEDKLKNRS